MYIDRFIDVACERECRIINDCLLSDESALPEHALLASAAAKSAFSIIVSGTWAVEHLSQREPICPLLAWLQKIIW